MDLLLCVAKDPLLQLTLICPPTSKTKPSASVLLLWWRFISDHCDIKTVHLPLCPFYWCSCSLVWDSVGSLCPMMLYKCCFRGFLPTLTRFWKTHYMCFILALKWPLLEIVKQSYHSEDWFLYSAVFWVLISLPEIKSHSLCIVLNVEQSSYSIYLRAKSHLASCVREFYWNCNKGQISFQADSEGDGTEILLELLIQSELSFPVRYYTDLLISLFFLSFCEKHTD